MKKQGLIGLMILAILAATIGSTAIASASAPGAASAKAKKKCKRPYTAKKRCKKKRRVDATHVPVIRATLTWFNRDAIDVDADLFVFDADGNRAGNGSNGIPLSSFTGDVTGRAGSETFTDGLFTPQAARDLSFGVCISGRDAARTSFTITYVTADGAIHGDSRISASRAHFDYPGGAPIPSGYCR